LAVIGHIHKEECFALLVTTWVESNSCSGVTSSSLGQELVNCDRDFCGVLRSVQCVITAVTVILVDNLPIESHFTLNNTNI
jgi:hypothetical protein